MVHKALRNGAWGLAAQHALPTSYLSALQAPSMEAHAPGNAPAAVATHDLPYL